MSDPTEPHHADTPEATPTTGPWWDRYALLERFLIECGRYPTQRETYAGIRIGSWVDSQRSAHRRGSLAPDRIRLLEALPGWSWGRRVGKRTGLPWEVAYPLVVARMAETGQVPVATEIIDGPSGPFRIGAWCHRRKAAHARGTLPHTEFVLLDQIPGWEWATPTLSWMGTYHLLLEWVDRHGHLPGEDVVVTVIMPGRADLDTATTDGIGPVPVRLGNWCRLQRYATGRHRLSARQVELLERVPGWTWPDRVL